MNKKPDSMSGISYLGTINAYEQGKKAFEDFNRLPAFRFPLDEHKEHNSLRWNCKLHINPFPKGGGSLKDTYGLHEQWQAGWDDAREAYLEAHLFNRE